MSDKPGRQQLSGYVMRDYDHAVVALAASAQRQDLGVNETARRAGMSSGALSEALRGIHQLSGGRLFALADALGYDLALVPREEAP